MMEAEGTLSAIQNPCDAQQQFVFVCLPVWWSHGPLTNHKIKNEFLRFYENGSNFIVNHAN